MSAPVDVDLPPLACGRDPLALADRAATDRLETHDVDCPFCGEVVDAVATSRRWGAVGADVADDGPARDVVSGVMRTIRAELRHARFVALDSAYGTAYATDRVVAAVLLDALDRLGALVVCSCEVLPDPGGGLWVELETHARYGVDLAAAAAACREQVQATLQQEFALTAAEIAIAVVDLIGPDS